MTRVLFIAALVGAFAANAQPPGSAAAILDEAKAQAAGSRLIFADFHASW